MKNLNVSEQENKGKSKHGASKSKGYFLTLLFFSAWILDLQTAEVFCVIFSNTDSNVASHLSCNNLFSSR